LKKDGGGKTSAARAKNPRVCAENDTTKGNTLPAADDAQTRTIALTARIWPDDPPVKRFLTIFPVMFLGCFLRHELFVQIWNNYMT
jgi:hypothetical protein